MTTPRRHHILPIAYQKQFSDDPSKIWTYDKETQKSFQTSPKNVSVRRDYNSALTKDLKVDHRQIEQLFSANESGYPETVRALRAGAQAGPELAHATQFMMLQATRTPLARTLMSKLLLRFSPINEHALRALGVEDLGIELLNRARAGDKESKDRLGLQSTLHLLMGLAKILNPLWYRPIRCVGNIQLISGDGPVIYFGVTKQRKKLKAGLSVPGRRILCCFPMANNLFIFGDSEKPPEHAFLSTELSQTTDSIALAKCINRCVAMGSDKNLIAGSCDALEKTIKTLPKKTTPTSLIDAQTKLGKELLKLNRARWGCD